MYSRNKQILAKKMSENAEPKERTYYCSMDKPFGLPQHHVNIIWLGISHFLGFSGLIMWIFGYVPRSIIIPYLIYGYMGGIGMTVGAHRYWSHKAFKAKLPLQIILMLAQTIGVQYPIFKWTRDHYLHHKHTETDADPHSARNGFWFSHCGWLLVPEHPDCKEKLKAIDLTELDNDPVIRFQTKYYYILVFLMHLLIPMLIVHFFFPEATFYQLLCTNKARYIGSLHGAYFVNSAAHSFGYKPYDQSIFASENLLVSALAVGEGWHNFHHTFAFDYKAAEVGLYKYNWSVAVIEFFAKIGWAYDLRSVPEEFVRSRIKRTGSEKEHDIHLNTSLTRFLYSFVRAKVHPKFVPAASNVNPDENVLDNNKQSPLDVGRGKNKD